MSTLYPVLIQEDETKHSFPPRPPYDTLKVDVWSLGATVWEMAQRDPPFADTQQLADRWPPLDRPELFSPPFHAFLEKCSEPAATRPSPSELLKVRFSTWVYAK